jgi:nitrous oxide reductase accessory protein NosL
MTTMRAATNRDLAAAKFARDYARQNKGVIDDNFFDAMAGFYAKNPVVTPAMPATNAKGIPFSVEAIDAELAKRQGGGAR